jgi:hypothetical protein
MLRPGLLFAPNDYPFNVQTRRDRVYKVFIRDETKGMLLMLPKILQEEAEEASADGIVFVFRSRDFGSLIHGSFLRPQYVPIDAQTFVVELDI